MKNDMIPNILDTNTRVFTCCALQCNHVVTALVPSSLGIINVGVSRRV
jgi:hypothetical protein